MELLEVFDMATKLEKLEVDRADGVKSPATQRKFLLLKTEDPSELRANFQELAEETHDFLVALQKEADFEPSEELAEAAAALGEKLAVEKAGNFKKKKPTAAEEDDLEPVCSCKGKKVKKTEAEESEVDLADVIEKSISKGFEKLTAAIAKASEEEESEEPAEDDDSDEAWEGKPAPAEKKAKKPAVSKQAEEEPVKKESDLHMGCSFADVVCGRRGRK